MKSPTALLLLGLSSAFLSTRRGGGAHGFSTTAPTMTRSRTTTTPMTMGLRLPSFGSRIGASKVDSKTRAFSTQKEVILREFEKKEAMYEKRREEAMAKLNQYEESLQSLRSKKSEYMAADQVADAPPGGTFSETALRSAVKAFCWRIVAGTVTFITSLQFSGSYAVALKIVGSDFFSKAATMFIGERLMNKSKAGREKGADGVGRSLTKALLWRLFAIANTLTMAVFVSKDLSIASKIASTDAVFKTALMFFYERLWARIEWGKEYLIEYSL